MPSILIIDDDEVHRKSLKQALRGFDIVGEADNAEQAALLVKDRRPEVILLGLIKSGGEGLWIIDKLRALNTNSKILVLSDKQSHGFMSLFRDSDGYVVKNVGREVLIEAIYSVLNENVFLCTLSDVANAKRNARKRNLECITVKDFESYRMKKSS